MANRCVSPINALPSKMRYGAVRARAIRYGSFAIDAELPCINGLSAWFTIAHVDAIDDHELLMTDGAIGNAKDIAEAIAAALAKPASSPAGGGVVDRQALYAACKVYNESLEPSANKFGATERIIRAYLAALSQSTSAGRVGG